MLSNYLIFHLSALFLLDKTEEQKAEKERLKKLDEEWKAAHASKIEKEIAHSK